MSDGDGRDAVASRYATERGQDDALSFRRLHCELLLRVKAHSSGRPRAGEASTPLGTSCTRAGSRGLTTPLGRGDGAVRDAVFLVWRRRARRLCHCDGTPGQAPETGLIWCCRVTARASLLPALLETITFWPHAASRSSPRPLPAQRPEANAHPRVAADRFVCGQVARLVNAPMAR